MKKETLKTFKNAPLPFMGQKRRFVKHFNEALENYPTSGVYVDLFGGSGLLSHTVKQKYPDARVIYNDFDNYSERIRNVGQTNKLLADLRIILKDYPRDKVIRDEKREAVLNRIKQEDDSGFVDFITISSSILFSMNYATTFSQLSTQTLYNCVRMSDYQAEGYLEGVEIVTKDYKDLFAEFKAVSNVVFLVDPPYLSTEAGTYKSYWKLRDYLDVLKVLEETNYFYFTSNKSNIIELCEWIETRTPMSNPFKDSYKVEVNSNITHKASYTDIMMYKQWTSSHT